MKPLSTSLVLFGLLALVQPALHARFRAAAKVEQDLAASGGKLSRTPHGQRTP